MTDCGVAFTLDSIGLSSVRLEPQRPGVADRFARTARGVGRWTTASTTRGLGVTMSKRGRKRRSRKGSAANHGKRPNA